MEIETFKGNREQVRHLFEQEMYLERWCYPKNAEQSFGLVDEIAGLARQGKHIAIVDGSFDVPQPNHQWYLHHCRLLAAGHFADKTNIPFASHRDQASADEVFLIVTLDTDAKLADIKGGRSDKGGAPRPVYPWELRAQYVSNFMTPYGENGSYRPVVDMVTTDGHLDEIGTPNESHLAFGAALLEKNALHSWLFYGEHDEKLKQAQSIVDMSGGSARIDVIPDQLSYCVDENGQAWSSSGIIKRIRGEA